MTILDILCCKLILQADLKSMQKTFILVYPRSGYVNGINAIDKIKIPDLKHIVL
jgi:hypothetical protein